MQQSILLLSVFIALLGIGIIVPVMPVFAESLGATGIGLGLIIAAFSVTRGFFQPIAGSFSDRWGRKPFLLGGLLVYGLVGLLLPEASSIGGLIAVRAVHGFGSAMIVPVAMAYMGDLAPAGQEGRSMGMVNIAIFSGIGAGPVLGGFFTDLWGMRAAFFAMACLSALAFFLVLLRLPDSEGKKAAGDRLRLGQALRAMSASRRTMGILLARMATMIIMVPTMAFLPLLMHRMFAASGTQIGMVIACRTLVNAALQTPCGRLADRHDKVRLLRIGCTIIAAVICLVPLAADFRALLVLFIILGMGEAMIWPALGAMAAEEGRIYGQGTMMGVFNLAMSCGVFLGAMAAGSGADFLGLHWSFPLIGAVVLATTLTATVMIRSAKQPPLPQKERQPPST